MVVIIIIVALVLVFFILPILIIMFLFPPIMISASPSRARCGPPPEPVGARQTPGPAQR